MLIKSIKSKDNKITVKYVKENSTGLDDEITLSSKDIPKADFGKSFQGLQFIVNKLLPGLVKYPWLFSAEEVVFKNDNDEFGEPFISSIFIAGRIVSDSSVCLQVKTDEIYKSLLSEEIMSIINALLEETRLFVRGYRAQDKLFDPVESEAS